MTIGLITPYYPDEKTKFSGIANHYFTLAKALEKEGHKVVVFHIRPYYINEFSEFRPAETDRPLVVLKLFRMPAFLNRLFSKNWTYHFFLERWLAMRYTSSILNKLIRTYNLDVIETSSYFSLCYYPSFKALNIPIVTRFSTTYRQMLEDHYEFSSRLMNKIADYEDILIKKAKNLITHSQNHAENIKSLLDISDKPITIIPHGIELPALLEQVANEEITILYVGRFEYRKGTDILLKAIPILFQNTKIKFNLILSGYDENQQYEKQFIAENMNEDFLGNVIFAGVTSEYELDQYYRTCDIFVAPSRYESFGLIYIEAMSYGKPVIGCEVGGVVEIIEHLYNGLFAKSDDPADLATKIQLILEDPQLRNTLGKHARLTVEQKFSSEILAKNSINYYKKAIENDA